MRVELAEDETARSYRVERRRVESIEYKRALMRYGFPICLPSAILAYFLIPESATIAVFMSVLPFIMMVIFSVTPFMSRIFHNRWKITDDALHLRGEHYGKIRWTKVVFWQTQRLPQLPGYYEICVRGYRTGSTSIILAEDLWALGTFESLAPASMKKTEHVVAPDRSLPATLNSMSSVRGPED